MKNIERKEVQELLCEKLTNEIFSCNDFKSFGFNGEKYEHRLGGWLKAEYVEPKYYWHIKGFGKIWYLNYRSNTPSICTTDEVDFESKTRFTEQEYRELSERFGFDFNMFEREDVE